MSLKNKIPYIVAGGVYLLTSIVGTGCTPAKNLDITGSQIGCSPYSTEALEIARELHGDPNINKLDFRSDQKNLDDFPGLLCDLKVTRDSLTGKLLRADYHISDTNAFPMPVNAIRYPITE